MGVSLCYPAVSTNANNKLLIASMFDILMFLFESYFDADSYPDNEKLTRKLSAAGFEDDEISDALTWLSSLHQTNTDIYPPDLNHGGIRLFAQFEMQYLSDEARSYLVFAEHHRMISPVEREMIIDRAIALKYNSLGIDKIKLIMLIVLWNRHAALDPMLVEELLSSPSANQFH